MVLFLLGTVNPSSLEIAAALAVWACGLALVFETEHRVDRWLVAQLGLAAIALALARQLGPLWLGLIAVTLVVVAPRSAWRRLAGSRAAQAWLAGVIAAVAAQLVWILLYNPFDAPEAPLRLPASAIDRIVVGKGYSLFLQMIGVFGWLDTSPPSGTWLVWTLAIGGLLVLAAAFGRARFRWAIAGLVLMTVLIPMVAEAREAGHTGLYWQGRYTLPLAVGVPILAAVALIRSDRMPRLDRTGFFASVGGLLVLAQVLAYGQNLRRYIVGRNGPIQFWTGSGWSPPVPGLLLLVAFAVTMTLLTVWLLAPRPATADPPEDPVVTSSTGV
jgi:hypothetical protein